jgi:N6-L-threonylcarbamoyladenine synthase
MKILAIESSCDETAAAVVEDGVKILSNVVASSTAMHEKYGGIVPEVAAREQLKCIIPTIKEATRNVSYDKIAVTVGPGLIGSLLIGVETAKTMALISGKPLIPVNHVLAHMYANFIQSSEENSPRALSRGHIQFPAISLVVSGGHTELFLMKNNHNLHWLGGTLDDAAGEAFDKSARLLGFGSRGGVAIQEAAQKCQMLNDKWPIKLPRPLLFDKSLNFSFSGLKTAVMREWKKHPHSQEAFAYEVQEAITDVLVAKTKNAAEKYNANSILISGGVAANLRLREKLSDAIAPPITLCTDNAVYIASYAFFRGNPVDWHDITAVPDLSVEVTK